MSHVQSVDQETIWQDIVTDHASALDVITTKKQLIHQAMFMEEGPVQAYRHFSIYGPKTQQLLLEKLQLRGYGRSI